MISLAVLVCVSALGLGAVLWPNRSIDTMHRNGQSATPEAIPSLADWSAEQLEKLLQLPTDSADTVSSDQPLAEFDTLAWTERLEQAIEKLKTDYSEDAQAQHLYGLTQLRLKRTQKAEPSLRQAVVLAPDDVRIRTDLADLLVQLGRDSEAVEVLETNATTLRTDVVYWTILGQCQQRLGQLAAAESSLSKATQASSTGNKSQVWQTLSEIQLQQQKFSDSIRSAEKSIELDPAEPTAWLLLSRGLRLSGKASEAQQALQRLSLLREQDISAENKLAFEVKHAREMSRVFGSAFRALGDFYRSRRQPTLAHNMLETATQVDPNNASTIAAWAAVMMQLENVDRAAQLNRQLLRIEPGELAHYQNLANCYMQINRPLEAEASLRLACIKHPEQGNGQLLLARFLLLVGKPTEALLPAQMAVKLLDSAEARAVLSQAQSSLPGS